MTPTALTITVSIISALAAVSGILIGWTSRARANRQDIRLDAESDAVMRRDVEYIKQTVTDIRADMRLQGQRMDDISERLTRVEESSKQAHKRIDELGRGGNGKT